MNIQDIADFLDLVKNPDKYEARLQALRDEQGRLNAAIETVGKASELDSLRKEVESQRDSLQITFDQTLKNHEAQVAQEIELLRKKRIDAENSIAASNNLSQLADQRLSEAKQLVASYEGREKAIRQAEDGIRVRQEQLDALVSEYNEKVAKLRSVMA